MSFAFEAVPADWGVFDCQRLATDAELTACHHQCGECGNTLRDKHGWSAGGLVLGYRFAADGMWVWSPVLCRDCDIAASKADGY